MPSSSKKASLPKWEGAKYASGSRPPCVCTVLIHVQPVFLCCCNIKVLTSCVYTDGTETGIWM